MILTLFDQDQAVDLALPERVTGRYILTTTDQNKRTIDLLAVEAEEGQWYLKSNKRACIKGVDNKMMPKVPVEPFKTYTIHREDGQPALLYIDPPSPDRNIYTKHHATAKSIKIGRAKDAQICYTNKLVSSTHCVIEYDHAGNATLRDLGSANGTYVNGKIVTETQLVIGDVIYIMGLKIIFNGTMLALNNPHQLVLLDRGAFKPFISEEPAQQLDENLDELHEETGTEELFYRSPRFKRDIERKIIKIDPPPQRNDPDELPLLLMLGPSVTMGLASMFTGVVILQNVLSNGGNIMTAMPMLVMSVSMLIGMILWPILTKRFENKRRAAKEAIRQEKYLGYLKEMEQAIQMEIQHQSEILHENHLPVEKLLGRIKQRDRSLWERSAGQNDFLTVRLGLGDLPLAAEVKYPEKKFSVEDDNLQDELYKLAAKPHELHGVPVSLSMTEERISGIIGKDRSKTIDFVKGLIFQLTTLHSYDELKLVFIYDKCEQEAWKFTKWLPHVWTDARDVRFIASDASEVKELSSFLEKEINSRSAVPENEWDGAKQHYVIFSMCKELGDKAEMLNLLLNEKRDIGFSLITLYDELKNLPKECSTVIELTNYASRIFDKDDISGRFTAFRADIYLRGDVEELAIGLANIHLAALQKAYTLPEMLTFLEMFGVSKIEHLNVLTRWKENNPTLTLETPIGVNTMGEPFKLDLHEKYHGPHGLIAGMTGSGKSEFIMTFILSLAVNYHPDEVAFILIDYKGGGMANSFTSLPHLAGTITNLDGAAVKRSLVSIQSELKRRQAIFSEASRQVQESNLDIYKYQKLYREGAVTEPLQHLFIISDEFAELKTQQPEFMEQLVSAARIGRSLGVHLILATQKPSGVVDDQIWSNSKFRISLKVQEKADSMEVIKRPDAAELSTTGRFYLQVGYNELFEMGQSAWGGAPYVPAEKVEKNKDDSIAVIDNLGRVVKNLKPKKLQLLTNPPKQLDEITKYLANMAKQENIRVKPLWMDPIPARIYLDQLKKKYGIAKAAVGLELNPVIGEYDNPANQSQELLTLPITRDGNTIIYGVAGSGKTTMLSTLVYSLLEGHTPNEVNMYLLDFSAETFAWFKEAPHVGDVVLSHENEKVANLFKQLTKEIENRKKILAPFGGDFNAYHRKAGTTHQIEHLPALVVAIHNYSAFAEMYEEHEEAVSYLTREGTKYGIYFVLTAAHTGAVRYKLLQNFKQLLVLQLNDQTEYSGILGSTDGVYPSKYKGRGIFKSEGVAYEFQTAKITNESEDMFRFITDYCRSVRGRWSGAPAKRIPILPDKVDTSYIKDQAGSIHSLTDLPVGVDKQSLDVVTHDFTSSFVNLVLSNQTEVPFIAGLVELVSSTGDQVLWLSPGSAGTNNQSYRKITTRTDLEAVTVELFQTLVYRNNTTKDALQQGNEAPVFPKLTCFIDSFTQYRQLLSDDGRDKLQVFLDKGAGLNVHIIIIDSAENLNAFTYEPWFKANVSLTEGIWAGSGIGEQYLLKLGKVTTEMYQEIPEDFGYVVKKGKAVLVKLLTASEQKEGVLIHG